MQLRFINDGLIFNLSKIHTPAGVLTGEEFFIQREDLKNQIMDTTLSKFGYEKITGIYDDESEEDCDCNSEEMVDEEVISFHINIPGWDGAYQLFDNISINVWLYQKKPIYLYC